MRLSRRHAALLMALTFTQTTTAIAQNPPAAPVLISSRDGLNVGVTADPCVELEPAPAVIVAYMAQSAKARAANQPPPVPSRDDLEVYNAWRSRLASKDFSGRCTYEQANKSLPPATDHRVVLFGDSITELWGAIDPGFFKDDTVNRGVSGQTTDQMVGRFRTDVIGLDPKVVLILAGSNDVAGNTGPTSLARIEDNIQAMVELAGAHHIRVILGSLPPTSGFSWRPAIHPVETIKQLNSWLRSYAQDHGLIYVDYYAALVDANGGFTKNLTTDGVHPNADGYRLMRPLAAHAIRQALDAGDPHPQRSTSPTWR